MLPSLFSLSDDPHDTALPSTDASRIKADGFHLTLRIAVHSAHPLRGQFYAELADTIYVKDPDDSRNLRAHLATLDEPLTLEEAMLSRRKWCLARLKTTIRAGGPLAAAVEALTSKYSLIPDFFTKTGLQNIPAVIDTLRRGYASDPSLIPMYEEVGYDVHGLMVYRCLRGSSDVEGLHRQLISHMSAYSASPELTDMYLVPVRHRWSTSVRLRFLDLQAAHRMVRTGWAQQSVWKDLSRPL